MPSVIRGEPQSEDVSLTPALSSNTRTQHWALAPGTCREHANTWAAGTSLCTPTPSSLPLLTAPPRMHVGAPPGGQQAEGEQAGDSADPRGWTDGSSAVAGGQERASSCRDESPDL